MRDDKRNETKKGEIFGKKEKSGNKENALLIKGQLECIECPQQEPRSQVIKVKETEKAKLRSGIKSQTM